MPQHHSRHNLATPTDVRSQLAASHSLDRPIQSKWAKRGCENDNVYRKLAMGVRSRGRSLNTIAAKMEKPLALPCPAFKSHRGNP